MAEKEKIEKNIIKLAGGLNVFQIPKLVTTQYARGLGNTTSEVGAAYGEFEKKKKTPLVQKQNLRSRRRIW